MRLITPESKFEYHIDCESVEVDKALGEKLIGDKYFELDSLFGKRDVLYNGEIDAELITFTRVNRGTRGSLYPSCKIERALDRENKTIVFVKCGLSIYWVVFLYFIYIVSMFGFVYQSVNNFSIYKLLAFIGGLAILNTIVFLTHFLEVAHYKEIMKKVLLEMGAVKCID